MRQIILQEHRPSEPLPLSFAERDGLATLLPSLAIRPVVGQHDMFVLTPDSIIGAVVLPGLEVIMRPKLPIDRVLFLISYALDPKNWKQSAFAFAETTSLVEAIIPGFIFHLKQALCRGLLQGYRAEEDSLTTVRGRIRFPEQLRRRFGIAPPIEVAFDEFTEDILENRLLKAALERLQRIHLRSDGIRRQLRFFEQALQNICLVNFDPRAFPEIHFSRLNEHYRPALELAKLILRGGAFELHPGRRLGSAFLVDMNQVFETFVTVALREALGLSAREWRQNATGQNIRLDDAGKIRLEPDLTWWEQGACCFVGDVKYKRLKDNGIKHADLYQLLAYTIATNLDAGLLIYAAGENEPVEHSIVNLVKRLEIVVVNLAGTPAEVLAEVAKVAARVKLQRAANLNSYL